MYNSNYKVIRPTLKSNYNNYSPKENPIFGSIENCFTSNILSKHNLNSIKFDFFVIWDKSKKTGCFNNTIWLKRSIALNNPDEDSTINIGHFRKKLIECETNDYILNSQKFFEKYELNASYMTIKDIPDKSISICKCFNNYENNNLVISCPVSTEFTIKDFKFYNLKELRDELRENSGGTFKMNKPLNYSDTYLEHYLSKTADITGAVWPGDCDLLLYDEYLNCKCILEFKKCTDAGRNIPLLKQSFKNYYNNDKSKYIRLAILREYFSERENREIPLINVFYPTYKSTNDNFIKLELINGNHADLSVGKTSTVKIPIDPKENELYNFKNELIESILNLI